MIDLSLLPLVILYACVNQTSGRCHRAQRHESPLTPVTLFYGTAFAQSDKLPPFSSNHRHQACAAKAGTEAGPPGEDDMQRQREERKRVL